MFLCLIQILVVKVVFADVLVTLENGIIQGTESITINNKSFYSFQKVPYAAPPVGDLRFRAPIPPEPWTGILDATSNYAVCYQVSFDFVFETEDCLYLNIYTPQLSTENTTVKLPVIFYIHGGGFIVGTCLKNICGPEYLLEYDVVVVTVNYRLGPFGFLSTQDAVIPGNNGLKDQQLALKWMKDNIHLFGGDPDRITINGQSAGAASAAYHFLNKNSEDLFWGAICQSGTFLSPWSFQRNSRDIAFRTAGFLNETFLSNDNSTELLNFLQNIPAADLDQASYKLLLTENLENRQISQGYFYAPVLEVEHDGAFITKKMYGEFRKGNFVQKPLMIGITSEESLEDAANLTTLFENFKSYDEHLEWLVPEGLNVENTKEKALAGKVIKGLYTDGLLQNDLASGIRYFSDMSFTRSVIKHAEIQSKYTDVYFYQFSYAGDMGIVNITLPGTEKVAHTEDIRYLWRIDYDGYNNTDVTKFPPDDVTTHRRLLTLWTNFAKSLNPNAKSLEEAELLQNITWPSVKDDRPQNFYYLDIAKDLSIQDFPKIGTYLGWNLIFTLFGNGDFDTY